MVGSADWPIDQPDGGIIFQKYALKCPPLKSGENLLNH